MAVKTKTKIEEPAVNPFVDDDEPSAPSVQDQVVNTLAADGALVQDEVTRLDPETVGSFLQMAKDAGVDVDGCNSAEEGLIGLLRIVVDLKQRVDRLEQGRPQNPAKSRFDRTVPTGVDLKQIGPAFAHCSCLQRLGPGQKCNAHQRPGNDEGLCPEAFKAAKMLQSNVPMDVIRKRFTKA